MMKYNPFSCDAWLSKGGEDDNDSRDGALEQEKQQQQQIHGTVKGISFICFHEMTRWRQPSPPSSSSWPIVSPNNEPKITSRVSLEVEDSQ